MSHTHIVKRRKGHKEPYDNHKVYASCYAACVNVHIPKEKAEAICHKVTIAIDTWIMGKNTVSSEEIFRKIIKELKKHSMDASFMYETHRDIS